MALAAEVAPPVLDLPRPAVALLHQVGPQATRLTLGEAETLASKPQSTVARWLAELVEANVILRARRDEYVVPSRPTLALLLAETSPYARSVLLHHDALTWMGLPHAFACIPVRNHMPFSLEHAAPVLHLGAAPVLALDGASLPYAFRAHVRPRDRRSTTMRFPTAAAAEPDAIPRKIPTLDADFVLSLFAASADARIVQAALAAAMKLDLDARRVRERASRFVVEEAPLGRAYPNSLVLPKWLARFHDAAAASHARRFLAEGAGPPRTPAGEDE